MRPFLALLVFIVDAVAIVSVLGTRASAGRKLAWMAIVVGVPLVGALAWYTRGRRRFTGT
jgi:hypothetical protein